MKKKDEEQAVATVPPPDKAPPPETPEEPIEQTDPPEPTPEIWQVPVDLVNVDGANQRAEIDKPGLQGLIASMSLLGQMVPVAMLDLGKKVKRYRLVYGHRRLAAARKMGWETIDTFLYPLDTPEDDVTSLRLTENQQRIELTPIDEANGYAKAMKKHRIHAKELARLLKDIPANQLLVVEEPERRTAIRQCRCQQPICCRLMMMEPLDRSAPVSSGQDQSSSRISWKESKGSF